MKTRRIHSLLALACVGILLSCNAFSPRDSEKPESAAEWNSFPIQPQQVIQNLEYAYQYSQNMMKYGEIFTDDFRFFFDTQDVSDYGVSVEWDSETEEEMLVLLNNHLQSGTSMSLELVTVEAQPDDIQNESAEFYRAYQLTVFHDLEGMPDTFSGIGYFEIVKDSDGFWRMKQWRDYRTSQQEVTWGRLKYEISP